ncbi:hypothetical protein DFH09DRAFT_1069231 [Mycena vulgaris]|nr:hypothetical protein DFH09DRAFT_1069231 [Mycena vulgaris]
MNPSISIKSSPDGQVTREHRDLQFYVLIGVLCKAAMYAATGKPGNPPFRFTPFSFICGKGTNHSMLLPSLAALGGSPKPEHLRYWWDSRKKPRERTRSLWEQRRPSTSATFLHQVPLDALMRLPPCVAAHTLRNVTNDVVSTTSLYPLVGTLERQLRLIGVVYCTLGGGGGAGHGSGTRAEKGTGVGSSTVPVRAAKRARVNSAQVSEAQAATCTVTALGYTSKCPQRVTVLYDPIGAFARTHSARRQSRYGSILAFPPPSDSPAPPYSDSFHREVWDADDYRPTVQTYVARPVTPAALHPAPSVPPPAFLEPAFCADDDDDDVLTFAASADTRFSFQMQFSGKLHVQSRFSLAETDTDDGGYAEREWDREEAQTPTPVADNKRFASPLLMMPLSGSSRAREQQE